MSQLAIKGHPTRGKEVIQLLEMLGGIMSSKILGTEVFCGYYIHSKGHIDYKHYYYFDDAILFTLEEFEEKFPYKVGDKVIVWIDGYRSICNIRNMEWDSIANEIKYKIQDYWYSTINLQPYIEETIDKTKFPYEIGTRVSVKSPHIKKLATIVGLSYNSCACMQYEIKFDGEDVVVHYPTDLITPIITEQSMEERKYADLRLDVDQDDKLATEVTIDGNKITPPKNYLIGKITKVDNGMLIEFVKKQPQYPKDYEECCKVLGVDTQFCLKYLPHGTFSYKEKIIYNLQELIICRDAYWKLAGEELGLDKHWEPDWCNENKLKYCIECSFGTIDKTGSIVNGCFLAFPTKEMRDAFHDNFKELIEQCKEVL